MKNKINVNISPNPLDLQTLHCSQNDTEERKFYFTLHNNGEVIDTSDISDPIFEPFSVYKGGTEQLLPINTDDPTTSPIIADIQYPDEEKTEQEFTYRESPTTLDGNAVIESIKGNTLVWNQLANPSNYFSALFRATKSINENTVTLTDNRTSSSDNFGGASLLVRSIPVGHKVLVSFNITSLNITNFYRYSAYLRNSNGGSGASSTKYLTDTGIQKVILTATAEANQFAMNFYTSSATTGSTDTIVIKDIMVFDLTAMFGSTKADEIYAMEQSESGSGVNYFRSLFPLNYYSYGQKLLSFKGEGIKTTPNMANVEYEQGGINASVGKAYEQNKASLTTRLRVKSLIYNETGENYSLYFNSNLFDAVIQAYDSNGLSVTIAPPYNQWISSSPLSFTSTGSVAIAFRYKTNADITVDAISNINPVMYKSGEESTTSIPTLTYFPTGMKSAGSVYDELTNSKAITRVGEVDMGTLAWYVDQYGNLNANVDSSALGKANVMPNIVCANYPTIIFQERSQYTIPCITIVDDFTRVQVRNSGYSDASAFKTAMNGVMLQYELATEQVTQFTQASLICEDGESTLYQDVDSLVCDCTEVFSKDSGFKDCKIKFTNDGGVVYSNKIQLHIERKP